MYVHIHVYKKFGLKFESPNEVHDSIITDYLPVNIPL